MNETLSTEFSSLHETEEYRGPIRARTELPAVSGRCLLFRKPATYRATFSSVLHMFSLHAQKTPYRNFNFRPSWRNCATGTRLRLENPMDRLPEKFSDWKTL